MKTSLAILFVALACSATAFAADDDLIWLADGGRVRGTVMEESPSTGVRVKLADGTVRTFTRAQIKKIDYGSTGQAAPPSAVQPATFAPQQPPSSAAAAAGGGRPVRVHIESEQPDVTLEVINSTVFVSGSAGYAGGTDASTVCVAPCDLVVDGNREYRVGGKGYKLSEFFVLPRQSSVTLEVEAGDVNHYLIGFMGGTTAAMVGVVGGAFLLAGLAADKEDWAVGGAVTMGIATAVAVPLFILMGNSFTTVTTKEGTELALAEDLRLTSRGLAF